MKKQLLASASAAVLMVGTAGTVSAQSQTISTDVNGSVSSNTVQDTGGTTDNTIQSSGENTDGVTHIQENNGSANLLNLGTTVTALQDPAADTTVFANAFVGDTGDRLSSSDNNIGSTAGTRDNSVDSSFGPNGNNNDASGVIGVQQNNGHANAIGAGHAVVGLTDVDGTGTRPTLDQDAQTYTKSESNSGLADGDDDQLAVDAGQDRDNSVTSNAFDDFDGAATVQQNNGDGNAIGASTSIAGIAEDGVPRDEGEDVGKVDQDVDADARVVDTPANGVLDGGPEAESGSERTNTISNSFADFGGVVTVQENNGTHNALAASTAVLGMAPGTEISGEVDDAQDPGTVDQEIRSVGALGTAEGDTDGVQATDNGSDRDNKVNFDAFNDASGVATVQQNNGDVSSVNAATGVAAVTNDVNDNTDSGDDFSDSNGGVVQEAIAAGNTIDVNEGSDLDIEDNGSTRTNKLDDTFRRFSGTASLQQNNGNGNALNVASAVVAVSDADGDADDIIEGGVEQTSADAGDSGVRSLDTSDVGSDRDNIIQSGAFNSLSGEANVQQNNGDANTMNVAVAVAATDAKVDGGVTQTARADDNDLNEVDVGNELIDTESLDRYNRTNTISSAFRSLSGVANVQQNNGDANVMSVGVAVFGGGSVTGDSDGEPQTRAVEDGITQEKTIARQNQVRNVQAHDQTRDGFVPGEERFNKINNGSFDGTSGVNSVQQNSGNANTMDIAASVAGTAASVNGDVIQDPVGAQNESGGTDLDNTIGPSEAENVGIYSKDVTRRNTLSGGSFSDAAGVNSVQQNNGDANSINAATAVVAVAGEVAGDVTQDVSLTGTDIGHVNPLEDADTDDFTDVNSKRVNTTKNAFDSAEGIVTLQQNNGSANSLNAATAVAYAGSVTGGIDQDVDMDAEVTGDAETGIGISADRDNKVNNDAFDDASGVSTVQQNNGDGNYMGSGTAVTASLGNPVSQSSLSGSVSGSTVKTQQGNAGNNIGKNSVKNAFDNASGVATVQQNNGNNNVIQSSVTVSANVGN